LQYVVQELEAHTSSQPISLYVNDKYITFFQYLSSPVQLRGKLLMPCHVVIALSRGDEEHHRLGIGQGA